MSYSSQFPAAAYQSSSSSYSSQLPPSAYESSSSSSLSYSSQLPSSAYSSSSSSSSHSYSSQLPPSAYSSSSSSSHSYSSQLPPSAYQSESPSYSSQLPSSAYTSSSSHSYSSQFPSSAYQSDAHSPSSSSYSSQLPSSAYDSHPSSTSHSYSSQLPASAYQSSSSSSSYSPSQSSSYSSAYQSSSSSSYPPSSSSKKALIVGINYFFNAEARLNGCVNDAAFMKYLLITKFGVKEQDVLVLTDDKASDASHRPTRANIISGISWLTSSVKPGDSLFFSFSGHGSQVEDYDRDEADGMDETILPVDYKTAGPIVDDDLHRMLCAPIPPGAKLTCILDCCHSGTALDLPFVYSQGRLAKERNGSNKITHGDVILFSGCADSQTSADSKYLGKVAVFNGVLTYSFCQAIEASSRLTHNSLLELMHKFSAQKGFAQTIQLSSGKQFDLGTPFCI